MAGIKNYKCEGKVINYRLFYAYDPLPYLMYVLWTLASSSLSETLFYQDFR